MSHCYIDTDLVNHMEENNNEQLVLFVEEKEKDIDLNSFQLDRDNQYLKSMDYNKNWRLILF